MAAFDADAIYLLLALAFTLYIGYQLVQRWSKATDKRTKRIDETNAPVNHGPVEKVHNPIADYGTTWPNDLGFDTVREERKPIRLGVLGRIPNYAAGTLYRNGPGARQLRDDRGRVRWTTSHWFDGSAQTHKFELMSNASGESIESIVYSSRYSVDSLMNELGTTGRYDGYTFAQKRDPCMSVFRKVMCLFTPVPEVTKDGHNVPVTISATGVGFPASALPETNASGHKVPHLIGRSDEGHMKAIDPGTLEPIGVAHQSALHPLLKGPLSASHSKSDPVTGDVYNYNLDLGYETVYRIFCTSASTGETDIIATISGPDISPAYMHSFWLTENYVILAIWSAHLQAAGVKVLWEKNVMDAIAPFNPLRKTKWLVVDRKHRRGVVAAFESPAAFCFHTINAFEVPSATGNPQEVDVLCDLVEYDNLDVLHKFYFDNMRSSSPAAARWLRDVQPGCNQHYARYRLQILRTAAAVPAMTRDQILRKQRLPECRQAELMNTISSPTAGDLPTINPAFAGKQYRFFWNCSFSPRSTFVDAICKVDLDDPTSSLTWSENGHTPGEAIFIADPSSDDEDAGVLLTVVLDGFIGSSYVLCLDAKSMKELGRADCRGPLAFTFHGQHVPLSGRPPQDA